MNRQSFNLQSVGIKRRKNSLLNLCTRALLRQQFVGVLLKVRLSTAFDLSASMRFHGPVTAAELQGAELAVANDLRDTIVTS